MIGMSDSSKRGAAAICACVAVMVGIVQIIFFSITSYRFKYGAEDLLLSIKNNLESPFVNSVAARTQLGSDIPPLNQTEVKTGAFVEDWPGTINGCNCLYVNSCWRKNVRRG